MKRYLVQTFGCQMNVHDSRRIEEVLEADGWVPTDAPTTADLVLFNTCSVREKAEQKLRSAVGWLKPLKDERPDLVIAIAGCVAQQEGEALLKKIKHVDIVLGPDNIPELARLVENARHGSPPISRTVFDYDSPSFLVAKPREDRPEITSFVTVMKGCDERCTFCIVPYTRGEERYRSADEILAEIKSLVSGGVREITLLGQTVNSWYDPREPAPGEGESRFALLLRRIAAEVPDLARLRYTSPHPRHLTPALIDAHRDLDMLPEHVHMPVQSGSNRLLKRMLRRYTREEYLERIAALKSARPGLTLSTDIIVGFPGETDEDFAETLSLVREAGFVAAFGFKYSPRPHTPALKLGDDVTEEVKDARLAALFAVVEVQQNAHLASLVGKRDKVLIEGPSRDGSARWSGRSTRHEIVHVEVPEGVDPTGALVDVEIIQAFKHSLLGKVDGVIASPLAKKKPRAHLKVLGESTTT
jgi:tRNA-2-methylthio-N6-dimethylallyladenosine synthase